MENNKQTAVEWLIDQLRQLAHNQSTHLGMGDIRVTQGMLYDFEEQAKEMEKQQDKFTNSPIHDKKAIIEMMNKLHSKEMAEVVEFIKIKIETYGTNRNNTAVS